MSSSWIRPGDRVEDLDRIAQALDVTPRRHFAVLRELLHDEYDLPIGDVLISLYPDSANAPSRQRNLQRLTSAVNDAARAARVPLELATVGAKQLGDRRRIGFVTRPKPEQTARADLAESHGLQLMGTRRADDVSASEPVVRVLLWSDPADRDLAQKLWEPLKQSTVASGRYRFIIKDIHADMRLGEKVKVAREGLVAWADLVLLAVSPGLLAAGWKTELEPLLAGHIRDDRCLPVLLRPLSKNADLRTLHGRRIWSPKSGGWLAGLDSEADQSFSAVLAPRRVECANRLDDELHQAVDNVWNQQADVPLPDVDLVFQGAHGAVRDLTHIKHHIAGRRGHRGFAADEVPRAGDIDDVDDHVQSWALAADGKPLLALLGDSGIGKTITAQRLASTLWEIPGGPAAHYFDLRDISGIGAWDRVPPVQDILAQCVAGGWVEGGRPIPLDRAKQLVEEVLDDSRLWDTVLIIDGLDEVLVHLGRGEGQRFTNQLLRLRPVGQDPIVGERSKMMLTCRTHYFTDIHDQIGHFQDQTRGQIRSDDYEALSLLPVTRSQIAEYLAQVLGWTEAEVEQFLTSIHDLWDLASRPYLLGQLAEVLPGLAARHELGERIVAASVYRELATKWLVRDRDKHEIAADDKPLIMAYVAYRLWDSGGRSADIRMLKRWLADFIQAEGLQFHYAGKAPELLTNDLHTATFLVRHDEGDRGTFRFAHSSLAEYLLAAWLMHCLEQNQPAGWAIPVPGRETLEFLSQLLETHRERPQMVRTLTSWRTAYRPQVSETIFAFGLHAHAAGVDDVALTGIDLTGTDLRGITITGTQSRPLNLSGANLSGARLERSQLDHVHLRSANLDQARLDHAVWNHVDTAGSSTENITATGALLRYCDLQPLGAGVRLVPNKSPGQPAHPRASLTPRQGHTSQVLSAAFSPDGQRIVTASRDSTARIWDPKTGEQLLVVAMIAWAMASWIPETPPQLVSASAEAWRWLRVRIEDESGRFISQDPYEWHYPTRGRSGATTASIDCPN